jgi:hypothetical protein
VNPTTDRLLARLDDVWRSLSWDAALDWGVLLVGLVASMAFAWALRRAGAAARRWALGSPEPLMAELAKKVADPEAIWEPATNEFLARGLVAKVEVCLHGNVVKATSVVASGGRELLPDLTDREKGRLARLLDRAVKRVRERDRLAGREEALLAVRGRDGPVALPGDATRVPFRTRAR